MITEEEALKHRIRTNIITFEKQLDTLCLEMSMDPYKVSGTLRLFIINLNNIVCCFLSLTPSLPLY